MQLQRNTITITIHTARQKSTDRRSRLSLLRCPILPLSRIGLFLRLSLLCDILVPERELDRRPRRAIYRRPEVR